MAKKGSHYERLAIRTSRAWWKRANELAALFNMNVSQYIRMRVALYEQGKIEPNYKLIAATQAPSSNHFLWTQKREKLEVLAEKAGLTVPQFIRSLLPEDPGVHLNEKEIKPKKNFAPKSS